MDALAMQPEVTLLCREASQDIGRWVRLVTPDPYPEAMEVLRAAEGSDYATNAIMPTCRTSELWRDFHGLVV